MRVFLFCFRFLGSDNNSNLFVCQRHSAAYKKEGGEEGAELSEVGRLHLGDSLNIFRHASLLPLGNNLGNSRIPHTGSILFGKSQDFCQNSFFKQGCCF